MRSKLAPALLFLCLAAPALAANWADDRDPITAEFTQSKAICRAHKPVPALPRPAAPAPARSPSAEALYYGIGTPPDPAAAYQAALREHASGKDEGLFTGDAMLMTMYANGVGAPRDLDRAIALACTILGAPAEIDGRVTHLARLKAENWQGHDFSVCNDITSGYAEGLCAKHDADLTDSARNQRFASLTAGWSAAGQRAFAPLRRAATAYAEATAANEVDQSGSARGAMSIEAQQSQEAEFLDLLAALEQHRLPAASASADAADAELNALYTRLQSGGNTSDWGTVTKDGIRITERAWLRYRDAFLAFAHQRYPTLDPDHLRAVLTEQRTAGLKNFAQ